MELKLSELAANLGLTLKGEDATISGLNTLENAGPGEVTFLANPKYADLLATTRAAAVIIDEANADKVATALVSASPYLDFARAVQLFARPQGCLSGVHEQAFVHQDAEVGEGCDVYPFAFIGARAKLGKGCQIFPGGYVGEDCVLADGCIVYPNSTLMAGTVLGERCIIHAGCVLGSDGFGFAPTPTGMQKIPQIGTVTVGNDVEIGANAAIDRAVLEATKVGDGTKIDNLVQIGHNVELGQHCIIVSQVGISGSTKVGNQVTMAGQVGVAGHLNIGDGATLGPKTGVPKDVPAGATMGGIPAVDKSTYMRTLALMPTFPDMAKKLKKMEKELAALKERLDNG